MGSRQESGPGQDGEERGSSPSSVPGSGKAGQPSGFAEGGSADVLAPGARLAGLLAAVTGNNGAVLPALGDQEVLGVVVAGARMAAWAAWVQTVGLAEFARRRPGVMTGSRAAREVAEEAAWATNETWTRMLDLITQAATLTSRLPRTLEAMRGGRVSEYKAKIIEAQTEELSADDVAKADVILAAAGQVKNPAGLRDFSRRQVARLDPAAAERRKANARQYAHVRLFQEDSGNAGLSARQMSAAEAVIAWQNIERRALDLHAAGVAGTAGQLQVQATLDFLLGRATPGQAARSDAHDAQDACPDAHDAQDACPDAHDSTDQRARQRAHDVRGACLDTHDGTDAGAYENAHADRDGQEGACQDAHKAGRGGGRGGWAVNPVLLVPWDPSLGAPSGPAELPGFGLLDRDDTMDLLAAAGENPATRWCVTVHGQGGAAAAHGCVAGRRGLDALTGAGAGTAAGLAARFGVQLTPITAGACLHAHAEPGYKPSRKLQHLIEARNTRCTAPGCGRPAAGCDLDHTDPWEVSHLTCECNLAPLCRVHHQIKQAQGWKIEQPEPGVLVWVSPSGLIRTTRPSSYPD